MQQDYGSLARRRLAGQGPDPPRAWVLRANVRGVRRLDRWLADGYCSIGWRELGQVEPGTPRELLSARMAASYGPGGPVSLRSAVGNVDRFVNRMRVGDLVVTPDGPEVYLGVITSPCFFMPSHDEAQRRRVRWVNPSEPWHRGELSELTRARLRTMLTLTDATASLEEFVAHAGLPLEPSDWAGA